MKLEPSLFFTHEFVYQASWGAVPVQVAHTFFVLCVQYFKQGR